MGHHVSARLCLSWVRGRRCSGFACHVPGQRDTCVIPGRYLNERNALASRLAGHFNWALSKCATDDGASPERSQRACDDDELACCDIVADVRRRKYRRLGFHGHGGFLRCLLVQPAASPSTRLSTLTCSSMRGPTQDPTPRPKLTGRRLFAKLIPFSSPDLRRVRHDIQRDHGRCPVFP